MIFLHVPKCAGTSVITCLRTVYGDSLYHDIGFRAIKQRHLAWLWQKQLPLEPSTLPHEYRCIAGHFTYKKYSHLNLPMFVFLREPLTAVISQFSIGEYREITTFEKFVMDGANSMDHMVGPLDRYFFVGLQEHFTQSMEMLEWFANIQFDRPLAYRNHHKREKYQITNAQKDLFTSNNLKDIDLYARACDRFHQQTVIYNEQKQINPNLEKA